MKKNGKYVVYEVYWDIDGQVNSFCQTFLSLKKCVDYAERMSNNHPSDTFKIYRTEYEYLFNMWLEDTRLIWVCNKKHKIFEVREYLK